MRRLEEVLRQMCSAAKAIGNTELENKFAEGDESSPHIWQKKVFITLGGIHVSALEQICCFSSGNVWLG